MSIENFQNWIEEKEANFKAKKKLNSLIMKGANGFEGVIHRDGEDAVLGKQLHYRGYGDNVYAESRRAGGPANVNIRVTCNGNTMDVVTIRNRK